MKISFIGLGYVGLVSAIGFASKSHHIICYDIDKQKINELNNGHIPIYENGLTTLYKKHRNNITITTQLAEALNTTDITFICVGTPSKPDGSIDLTYITTALTSIADHLKTKPTWHLIVIKSTVVPGTTHQHLKPLLEKHTKKTVGKELGLATNPEFLREGQALEDFLQPDRIIIGSNDPKSTTTLQQLYRSFNAPIQTTSLSAAEMIKYASNAFLATKISFINEIGNLCKKLNINTYDVADGIGRDNRIGRAFLNAGIGWGGSCFPKDLQALITWGQQYQETLPLLKGVVTVNETQPHRLINLLTTHLPTLQNKTIGILGLAFKPDTDDIRETKAIPIINTLLKQGAIIKAYDPKAIDNFKQIFPHITYCTTPQDTLDADATLILTKWKEFEKLDYQGKLIIDGRYLPEAQAAQTYEGICW
jgi:UDPglucose 6-dehydrogenase